MGRIDHQLERRGDDFACLVGIEILHQVHQALDAGEQRGDGLALAVGRRAAIGISPQAMIPTLAWQLPVQGQRCTEPGRVLEMALRADHREWPGALTPEFHSLRIFRTAF